MNGMSNHLKPDFPQTLPLFLTCVMSVFYAKAKMAHESEVSSEHLSRLVTWIETPHMVPQTVAGMRQKNEQKGLEILT